MQGHNSHDSSVYDAGEEDGDDGQWHDARQMGHFDNINTNLFPAFLLFLKCPLGK